MTQAEDFDLGGAAGIRRKALNDLHHEIGALEENPFEAGIPDEKRNALFLLAVERAREAFLGGEDRNGFFPTVDVAPERWKELNPLISALSGVRAALGDEEKRRAALPIFNALAEDALPVLHALSRLVPLAPSIFEEGTFYLIFLDAPLRVLDEGSIRAVLQKPGLPEDAIEPAVQRIRAALRDTAADWTPSPAALAQRAEDEALLEGLPEAPFLGPVRLALRTGRALADVLSSRREGLVAEEAFAAGRAAEARHVAIPTESTLPVLFSGGLPLRYRDLVDTVSCEDADGNLERVRFELRLSDAEEAHATLSLPYEEFESRIKGELAPSTWRDDLLSNLPRMLGPDALVLYYYLWDRVDAEGDFAFHPAIIAERFGLVDERRTRAEIEDRLRRIASVRFKVTRKFGPSMGNLGMVDEGPLIEESEFKRTLLFPNRPRLPLRFFRHAKPMLEIREKNHVKLPSKAFGLVGGYRPGRGAKDAGTKALALLATAYVLARTFAGRTGKHRKREEEFLGADGYEIPAEKILLASGFTTPTQFRKNPKEALARAEEAVERLAREWRFLGPGSEVRNGRFRFEPTDALRADLVSVAEKKLASPERPAVIDVPPRKSRRGGGRGRRKR